MNRPRILIFDRGSFLTFAESLAGAAEVLYFSEFRELASYSKNAMVGRDVPGITRVDSFWNHIDSVDAIAFPDIFDGDLQEWLRGKGYPVWGCGRSEMLELDRGEFRRLLKKLGLAVIPYRLVVGLDDLEAILREENDLYLSTSFFRGDFETTHWDTWETMSGWFAGLRKSLGPYADDIEVIVAKPVKAREIGYDGYSVGSQFPILGAWGVELKDKGYIGAQCPVSEMPECIQVANDALGPVLGKLGMQGNYSNEIRVAEDGTFYINDPACRVGSPPGECMSLWITNWAEIVLEGAHGRLIEPEFDAPYAAEIELRSDWLQTDWLGLTIPAEVEPYVRLRRACVKDGRWWCVPSSWLDILGAAVGFGDTPEAALQTAAENAAQVQGIDVECDHHAEQQLLELWLEAQDLPAGEERAAV